MNKGVKIFLPLFFLLNFCFKSVTLPQDFKIKCSVWINLMPSPGEIEISRRINGTVQFKGELKEEIALSEIFIITHGEKVRIGFEKKEKNYYVLKDLPVLRPDEEVNFILKFKYKGKNFEKEIEKVKVGVVY